MKEEKKAEIKKSIPERIDKKIIAVAVAALLIAGGALYFKQQPNFSDFLKMPIGEEEAKKKAEDFIKNNLIRSDMEFSIKEVKEEYGLYKMAINVGQQEIFAYISKDGKKFFPQAMDIDAEKNSSNQPAGQPEKNSVENKKDIPEVDLFVMSYCPFGIQIEKGIIPALEVLGNKIKFSLKFVDYVMHPDDGEMEENIRQHCVQKEEPEKLVKYMVCFLKKGGETEAKNCLRTAGINLAKNDACFKAVDAQFEVLKKKNDKSAWSNGRFPPFDVDKADNEKYGVQGSPTLVINGEKISTNRDPQSLLSAVCSGFADKPADCDKKLSSETPTAAFGDGKTANSGETPSCGN